jgi:hypothetical protein
MTEEKKWWEEPEAPPCTVESPRPYVVQPRKKTEAQLDRETNGGRELPRPGCPYDLNHRPVNRVKDWPLCSTTRALHYATEARPAILHDLHALQKRK